MKKAAKKKAKARPAPAKKAKRPVAAAKKKKLTPKKAAVAKKKAPAKPAAKKTTKPVPKVKPAAKKASPVVKPAKPARPVAPKSPPPVPPAPVLSSSGVGTPENPWILKTPAGFSEFQAYRDPSANPPAVVVRVGTTELRYHLRCLDDLVAMLKAHGDWMLLGSADEQQPAAEGSVEAWARSPYNPVGGWYGQKAGLRGRFATYVPQVLEVLGLAEVEHYPNNNRMRLKR